MGREYLINGLDDDAVKAYFKFMVENAIIFGANRTEAESEMMEALELEFKLANVSVDSKYSLSEGLQSLFFTFVYS